MSSENGFEKLKESLAGKYDVEREIGRGGMATVYLARDVARDRPVAVKVLNSDLSVAMGVERFRREIQLAKELDHPNILKMYDAGEANASLYYVMPYVAGESLAARLIREKQLAVEEALRITCEVADALDYAHKRGIVHRDIKPENILLEDGKVLVADFGIARAISAADDQQKLTQTGMSLGTPTYMSPEQAMAERNIDGRSDVYSLGCVLYEMLIGQPPFVGPTAQAIIARQMLEDVPSLTVVRGTIPDDLEDAVLRALSKTPADRFNTTGEFAAALKACKESGGLTLGRAERRTRPRKVKRQKRSTGQIAAIGAAVVIVLGGAVALLAARSGDDGPSAIGGLAPERVAVLYFADRSRSSDLQHVADGLTESLIDELDQVRALNVVSANGVEQFRGAQVPSDSIGRALGVGTVVEGQLEEVGENLRVRVWLFDGNNAREIAKTDLTRPKSDLVALHDTLTYEVARLVRGRVGEQVQLRRQRAGTQNADAWALRQRAEQVRKDAAAKIRANDSTSGWAQFESADSLLTLAAQLDERWVEPVIARGNIALSRARLEKDPVRAARHVEAGLEHAERALALAPRNAAALELRGTLRYVKWRGHLTTDPAELSSLLAQAETDLRQAVTVEPGRASAWSSLAGVYYQKPDFVEATLATRRAYEEDAYLSNADGILWRLYTTAYDNEQFIDAVRYCDEGRRRFPTDPRFVRCRLWLYTTNAVDSNVSQAWATVERLRSLTPERDWPYAGREAQMLVAAAIGRSGMRDSAFRVLEGARGNPQVDPERDLLTTEAFIRTLLGDKDGAFTLMKQYLAAKPEHREGLAKSQSWWWRPLRGDPRFQELVGTVS